MGVENVSSIIGGLYFDIVEDMFPNWMGHFVYLPWIGAVCGSVLIGLSGVLPLLVIPIDQTDDLKHGG